MQIMLFALLKLHLFLILEHCVLLGFGICDDNYIFTSWKEIFSNSIEQFFKNVIFFKNKIFPLFSVLEATDTDSLLDQFEEETSLADNNVEYENPKKTSNIFKAVKNHFAASGQVNPKRNPRIGNLYLFIHISSQSLGGHF